MVARGLDVQAQIPPVSSPLNSCGKDAGTRSDDSLTGARVELLDRTNHPPQPPGVVMHPNRPDLRQRNRPGMNLADADPGTAIWSPLVADTEAVLAASFALAFRKTDPAVAPLGVSSEASAQVDRSLLKDLGGNLLSPGEPGHLLGRRPVWSNREDAAGPSLAFQRLNALIKSKLDQGTLTDGSAFSPASASVTS